MYEDLIKRLCWMEDVCKKDISCPVPCINECLFIEAADAIEKLSMKLHGDEAAIAGMKREIERMVVSSNKPRWIPVTERLPEERINPNTRDFEYVLCVTIWGDVRPFKYGTPIGQKEAHFWNGAGYVDAYVTHWMPLPEPPREET